MLKRTVKRVLSHPLGWRLAAPIRRPAVVVLMYHRIKTEDVPFKGLDRGAFREQMRWLRRNCEVIGPEEYRDHLRKPSRGRPAVLVTFDDGYRDYHDNAYPILQELRIPAVVFLATSFIGSNRMIWTDEVSTAIMRSPRPDIEFPWAPGKRHALGDTPSRIAATRAAKLYLKGIADTERKRLQEELFARLAFDPENNGFGRQMLSWDEVRLTREFTRYGAHTHTHSVLSRLTETEADEEVRKSSERIQEELGEDPRCFAYPNGRAEDFTRRTCESLQRYGFELGFTTIEGLNGPGTDPFAIRRQPAGAAALGDFAWLVTGR